MPDSTRRKTPGTRIFSVVFVSGDDVFNRPPEQRLRNLLKIAGRGLNLRCIQAKELGADEPALLSEVLADVIARIDEGGGCDGK